MQRYDDLYRINKFVTHQNHEKSILITIVILLFLCSSGGEGKATRLCSFDEQEIAAKWRPHEIQSCGDEKQVELADLPEVRNNAVQHNNFNMYINLRCFLDTLH